MYVLVFSVGNIIYLVLEFQNYVNRQMLNCDSGSWGWKSMLRIIFTILQTYVSFKHPKVSITFMHSYCGLPYFTIRHSG